MTPEGYVLSRYKYAKAVEAKTGMHYLIPLTQGALESGWGAKSIGNNDFGIKDTDGVNGNEQLVTTTEYLDTPKAKFPVVLKIEKYGRKWKYLVKDWFRVYASSEDAFMEHYQFFVKNPRYKTALQYKNNPDRFFEEIAKAGYATAPGYADMLKQVKQSVIKRLPK